MRLSYVVALEGGHGICYSGTVYSRLAWRERRWVRCYYVDLESAASDRTARGPIRTDEIVGLGGDGPPVIRRRL